MSLNTVFFYGNKSPYGMAHFAPILEQFDVKLVVIGTDERWQQFRQALGGKVYYFSDKPKDLLTQIKAVIKKFIPKKIIRLLKPSYHKIIHPVDFEKILKQKSIELWRIYDVNDDNTIKKLKLLNPDLFISAAYPQIFSKKLISIPNRGAINFHPALLPKFRGAHPHFWQIAKGEKTGGLTAHFMTERIDDGDIISQVSFPIAKLSYTELYNKLIDSTPEIVVKVRKFFSDEGASTTPQCDEEATYYRNNREIHSRIFWGINNSDDVKNLIRTGTAFCFFRDKKVNFISSYVTKSNRNLTNAVRVECGTIVDVGKDSLVIKTIDGCINITEIKVRNKKLSYLKWAKRNKIKIGEKFT